MNARQPSPGAQLSALLSRFSPKIVAQAKRCLTKLRRRLPGSLQLVYEYNHSVVVSFSQSEQGAEGIIALAIYPEWIRLYFQGGKFLPDPEGLLQGSAGVRFVTLESASDLDHKNIEALFKAVIKHFEVTFARGRKGRMIIKSLAKKPKPKKSKRA
jgi:hypothetical protein